MIFSLTDGRTSAWQWDRNLSLNVDDSEYQIEEIHMSNEATKGAFVCEMKDDRTVAIPNILLTASRDIFIYVVVSDNYGKRTELRETLHVHARKKPQDYVYTDTEVYEYRDYITRLEAVENTTLEIGNVFTVNSEEEARVNIRVQTNEDNSKTYYIDFYIPEGQQGEPGNPGANGKTPYIQNGYWYIDGVNLGVKAEGKPGTNGTSVTITRIIESTESGGTNIVEFSDGNRLNIRNGNDGEDGEGGGGGVIAETDPTVPNWAKQPNKPKYTASEVGALPATTKIPTKTSDLENDSEYVQLDDLSPYAKKKDIPSVPTKVSELTNDSGYLTSVPDEYVTETELAAKKYLTSYTETDPTVPAWAKQPEKPTYTAAEVGAEGKGAVSSAIVSHNTNPMAHNDIRVLITELENGKLDASKLPEAVNDALAQAKESGEFDGADGKSAYEYAQDGGYTGTEEEFAEKLAFLMGYSVYGYVDENNNILLTSDLADGTYTVKYEMEDGSILDIGELKFHYSVTNALTNCVNSNNATNAANGGAYSATISANSGYELRSIVVTMGDEDISSTVVSGGTISIESVKGDIVITATATEAVVATNFFKATPTVNTKETASQDALVIGGRYGSDMGYRADAGPNCLLSNYIPVQDGDEVVITNATVANAYSGLLTSIGDAKALGTFSLTAGGGEFVTDLSGSGFKITNASANYVRICLTPDNSLMVNSSSVNVNEKYDCSKIIVNVKRNGEWL